MQAPQLRLGQVDLLGELDTLHSKLHNEISCFISDAPVMKNVPCLRRLFLPFPLVPMSLHMNSPAVDRQVGGSTMQKMSIVVLESKLFPS